MNDIELDLCRELAEEHYSYPPTMSFKDPKFTIEQLLEILREKGFILWDISSDDNRVSAHFDKPGADRFDVDVDGYTLKEALLRACIAVMKEGGDA